MQEQDGIGMLCFLLIGSVAAGLSIGFATNPITGGCAAIAIACLLAFVSSFVEYVVRHLKK
jgi:hypothetical protein